MHNFRKILNFLKYTGQKTKNNVINTVKQKISNIKAAFNHPKYPDITLCFVLKKLSSPKQLLN